MGTTALLGVCDGCRQVVADVALTTRTVAFYPHDTDQAVAFEARVCPDCLKKPHLDDELAAERQLALDTLEDAHRLDGL